MCGWVCGRGRGRVCVGVGVGVGVGVWVRGRVGASVCGCVFFFGFLLESFLVIFQNKK